MLSEHTVGRTWHAATTLVRRHRIAAVIAGLIVVGGTAAGSVQAVGAGTPQAFWIPSPAQAEQAIIAAHLEASSTIPSRAGGPVTARTTQPQGGKSLVASAALASSWPSNITSISYIGSYRQTASQFLDRSAVPDDRPVIILRMTGHFSVAISSPSNAANYATGKVLTAVLDATNGHVLDFGLVDVAPPIPGSVLVFQR
jgi:hypothetical protein